MHRGILFENALLDIKGIDSIDNATRIYQENLGALLYILQYLCPMRCKTLILGHHETRDGAYKIKLIYILTHVVRRIVASLYSL